MKKSEWLSRKTIMSLLIWISSFSVATIALFLNVFTADHWVNLVEFLTVSVLGLHNVSNITEKVLMKEKVPEEVPEIKRSNLL